MSTVVNKSDIEIFVTELIIDGKSSKSRSWVMSDIVKNVRVKFGSAASAYAREFIIENYLVNK